MEDSHSSPLTSSLGTHEFEDGSGVEGGVKQHLTRKSVDSCHHDRGKRFKDTITPG